MKVAIKTMHAPVGKSKRRLKNIPPTAEKLPKIAEKHKISFIFSESRKADAAGMKSNEKTRKPPTNFNINETVTPDKNIKEYLYALTFIPSASASLLSNNRDFS